MIQTATKELTSLATDLLQVDVPSVRGYCDRVILPDGPMRGLPYNPDLDPAQRIIIQAIDAGATSVVLPKPVQSGGSLVSFVPIMRRVVTLGQKALLAFPTVDAIKDIFSTKMRPVLLANGCDSSEAEVGGGSRGGAARTMMLPNGGTFFLRGVGGRGESGQASVTVDCGLFDEVDDMVELRRVRLLERRLSASADPFAIYVSTVKSDGEGVNGSIILQLYAESTQSRLAYPCPHCNVVYRLEWEQVDVEHRRLVCPHCAAPITEKQRQEMLQHAVRQDDNPGCRVFGLRWTSLDCPFPLVINGQKLPTIEALCTEFEQARQAAQQGDPGLLRQFYRDRLTQRFVDDEFGNVSGVTISEIHGASLQSTHHRGYLPTDSRIVTIGVDVQLRRIYWVALAMNTEGRRYVVDWGKLAVCGDQESPRPGELEAAFDKVKALASAGWEFMDGNGTMHAHLTLVDAGFRTDVVRQYVAKQCGRWLSVKGYGGESAEKTLKSAELGTSDRREPGWYDLRRQESMPDGRQLLVDQAPAIERICMGWPAGSIVPPKDRDDELYRHLAAYVKNNSSGKWECGKARVDFFDCTVYADNGLKLMSTIKPGLLAKDPRVKAAVAPPKPTQAHEKRANGQIKVNIFDRND